MKSSALNLFIPIKKVDEQKRLVYGILSAEVPDKAGEIMDYNSGKSEFEKWSGEIEKASNGKSKGNVRAMHGNVAAGVLKSITFNDGEKSIEGCAHIVDDAEWQKVLTGTYTGFSIGGSYSKRWKDPENPQLTRYTPNISEVSIVDNPCLGLATFDVIKADGQTEMRKFKTGEQDVKHTNVVEGIKQGWQAEDGTFHLTKAAALAHNGEQAAKKVLAPAQEALKKLDESTGDGDAANPPAEGGEVNDPSSAMGDPEGNDQGGGESVAPAAPEGTTVEQPAAQETPPAAEPATVEKLTKRAKDGKLKLGKALFDVGTIADVIAQLKCTQDWLESDALWGDGDASLPAALESTIKSLFDFLRTLVDAEAEKSASADELQKMTAERDELAKGVGDLTKNFEKLQERITKLEAQPQEPKAIVRALSKDDAAGSELSDAAVTEALSKMSEGEIAHVLMKAALRNGKDLAA